MQITRQFAADKLASYLRHEISLEQLVDWAEQQIMEADFESDRVRDAVARIGVADVRAFGLTWDDCQRLLRELGFDAQVQIESV
jgi:cobyrinic acid a,c-diamide synthase